MRQVSGRVARLRRDAGPRDDVSVLKISGALISIAAVVVCIPAAPLAQWLHYPTSGVPRTSSGSPNRNAPTPRTRDGKPDLSGIWEAERTRPCPPEGCDDMMISEQFLDIGWRVPGGLPYRPWAADLVTKRTADLRKDDPQSQCLPTGIVRMHTTPLYRKIVQVPGLVVILNERLAMYRQIFTDGRPLPIDPQPSWSGYSSGTWDGDTLIVRTSGFRDGLWLDAKGSPLTDAGTITERFRRVNFGKLEIELTVDDPKAYSASWTTKLNQFIFADTELLDYICAENERDVQHFVVR
jgi:hypothetical protein